MNNVLTRVAGAPLNLLRLLSNPFRFKQRRMLEEHATDVAVRIQAACITHKNFFTAPGIVQATDTHLIIAPVLGKKTAVPFERLTAAEETRWFNGQLRVLEFQHGFWVKGPGFDRIGFAVTDPEPWRALLAEHGLL